MSFCSDLFFSTCSNEAIELVSRSSSLESLESTSESYQHIFSRCKTKKISETPFSKKEYTPVAESEEEALLDENAANEAPISIETPINKRGFFSRVCCLPWKNIFFRLFGRPKAKPVLIYQDQVTFHPTQNEAINNAINSADKDRVKNLLAGGTMKIGGLAEAFLYSVKQKQEEIACYMLGAIDVHKNQKALYTYMQKTLVQALNISISLNCPKITNALLFSSRVKFSNHQLSEAFAHAARFGRLAAMKQIKIMLKDIAPKWKDEALVHAESEKHQAVIFYLNTLP